MDFTGDSSGSTRLACKSASSDVISLPQSKPQCRYPSDDGNTFSYLQYDLEDLAEHQFVAVVDKATSPTDGFVIAEYASDSESLVRPQLSLRRLLTSGMHLKLPPSKPLVTSIQVPALHSSLLAYKLRIKRSSANDDEELFTPLLRQHISEVYESKYFVNVQKEDLIHISLHGVAPYLPPPFKQGGAEEGLTLQIWSDPNLDSPFEISLDVDVLGSMGKLWMRYRTLFAAFPLLVVALVFRKQFKIYDETGVFMSFAESMNQCLRTSLPVLYTALTCLAISLAKSSHYPEKSQSGWVSNMRSNATEGLVDYSKNGLLLGSQDTFFWFLVPFFGLVCSGVCIMVNYAVLAITHLLTCIPALLKRLRRRNDDARRPSSAFSISSTRQRILTTSVLLLLVSTVIPYQFAYLVLCIVQLVTCVRALRVAREHRSEANYNFYNYAHSLLVLMLWVLPINMPTLVVWIRNLAVHWLTPFSSHHNIMSITPYILLVETISTGRMIPPVKARIRYFTNILFFAIALYAAVYGVTYAYLLHQLVNILCAWLVAIHFSTSSFSLSRLNRLLDGSLDADGHIKKRP